MTRRKHALECSCWCKYPNEDRRYSCLEYYVQRHPRSKERKTHCLLKEVYQDET